MKKNIAILVVVSFAVGMGLALAHVGLRLRVIQIGYALGTRLQEQRELEEEQRKLQLEQALLRNPERIEKVAHQRLGMLRPDPAHIRVVHVGRVVRELAQR